MNLAFVGMAAALGLSAAGSAFGAGFAGMSSVGAWKKCYAAGKPAPFIMIAFTGAPLTQTIYGYRHRPVRSVPGQDRSGFRRCARSDRKRYRELLHRHRYRRDRRLVHPGLLPAAAEQLRNRVRKRQLRRERRRTSGRTADRKPGGGPPFLGREKRIWERN